MMFRGCLLAGLTVSILALMYGMSMDFLLPYRPLLLHNYAVHIATYLGLLCFTVTAVLYSTIRACSMKTTGRKLEHMDRGLRHGGSVMQELSERLENE